MTVEEIELEREAQAAACDSHSWECRRVEIGDLAAWLTRCAKCGAKWQGNPFQRKTSYTTCGA